LSVSTHNVEDGNGHGGKPGKLLHVRSLDRFSMDRFAEVIRPMEDRRLQLADLTVKQARKEPDAPGAWPRFLLKHACWILAVTIAALAGAHLFLHSQTRMYKSQATVVVVPPASQSGTQQATDMATEKGVASSNVVLSIAARTLKVPTSQLLNGLAVTSPGSTYLLNIAYTNPNKSIARQRAEAIAEAYVAYRTPPKPVPVTTTNSKGKKTTTTTPVVITTPTATLITPAVLPTSQSSPKPGLVYAIAVLLGLSLGIGTAALRDRLSDRLRGPADLEACAATPLVALIPAFWRVGWKPARRLVMLRHAESVVADAYRSLRARIVQTTDVPGARTVVVTSPAREDKDAVAANLAVALAQSGQSTVLVCADPRWGQAHRLLGVGDTEGITGILDQRTLLVDALVPVIPGLEVVPAGPPPLDTSAVLQRPGFGAMLSVLTDTADFVVIAAPPVLASADARILADLTDMTLLVADARRSARAQVRTAVRELQPVHDKIAGCVFTGVGRRRLLWRPWKLRPAWNGLPAAASRHDDRADGREPVARHDDGGGHGSDYVEPAPPRGPKVTPGTHEDAREDDK
jgi:capsular exopolysaccharide synthesis family protein